MDEVDNIILETLRALECDIPNEVKSLNQFNVDLVVLSISTCLENTIPLSKFPKKLPPSMAARLKTASHLAEQIKDIGFQEEIGYQTILYFNEVEMRRLLIFLIEKLPRDSSSGTQTAEVGYIPKVMAILKNKTRNLFLPWIPSGLLYRGTHVQDDTLDVRSFGNSTNLKVKKLRILTPADNIDFKSYSVHILPTVTKQCSKHQLIPSLLFESCKFSKKNRAMLNYLKNIPFMETNIDPCIEQENSEIVPEHNSEIKASPEKQTTVQNNSTENLMEHLKHNEEKYLQLKKTIDNKQKILDKLNGIKDEEIGILRDKKNQLDIKTKTKSILNQGDNLQKLQLLVEKANSRLLQLHKQWEEVQTPLLKEYDSLMSSLSEMKSSMQMQEEKMKNTVATYEELVNDLKDKVELEKKLIEKLKQCTKNTNRSTYTKNIMEIINNIKKQNHEMQKILKDTREVQKDINSLTGQIDRSFLISDELIFSNAKRDEMSKNAYKLLVSLHNECGGIGKIVSDIGFTERECRNLQELIDIETSKGTSIKLARLNEDLDQIKEDNMNLIKQLQ